MIEPHDVEAIERATVAAVAPKIVREIDGWLVPLEDGPIGRAKSAVPLSHASSLDDLDRVFTAFAEQGLPPAFRLADTPGLDPTRAVLASRGFEDGKPTLVKVGGLSRLAAFAAPSAELLATPDAGWASVFLGEGFDPVDGAGRVKALSRSPGAIYAAIRECDRTLAVGVASASHGWGGIHGMRTVADRRGEGLASRILATLGGALIARGVRHAYLQVEEHNPARSLYRKAGFEEAWTYRYWTGGA